MNIKELLEKRSTLIETIGKMLDTAEVEKRSLNDDEVKLFNENKAAIDKIDETVKADDEHRNYVNTAAISTSAETREQLEERAFVNFVKSKTEERANLDMGSNGGIIPQTISNQIIKKIKETCPIYSLATVFNVKGKLILPLWEDNSGCENITCAYADEFTDLTEKTGKFATIELDQHLAGTLTKLSKSLINNTEFNVLPFVIEEMAKSINEFLEKEMIIGTNNKMQGVLSADVAVTTSSPTAITADEIIDLEMSINTSFVSGAVFIMNKSTLAILRKLKDATGKYILNESIQNGFGWEVLGHKVYITDVMPNVKAGTKAIVYGDISGLALKLSQSMEIQVLNEKYATQHAIGVVGYIECDSKIIDRQKIKVLQMKAGS